MNAVRCSLLVSLLCSGGTHAGATDSISPFIRHYEGLSYDREVVHRQHQRTKRETWRGPEVLLDFRAFHRAFHLRLKRDTSGFSHNFKIRFNNVSEEADLSQIYSGELQDETGSSCHGSILKGQFEGFIRTGNGTYYVEPLHRYSTSQLDYHSIIYHGDDVDTSPSGRRSDGFCGTEQLKRFVQTLRQEEEPTPRSKRTADRSKTSCLLHLYADHLYFRQFGSVEAVVTQVASYIAAVNDIYQRADFNGIRLINFKVKFLQVVTEEDPSSPLSQTFIGPEKLLSLFSQRDWSSYCLSYLLTSRDFSGVLGLAWEGQPGNWGGVCSNFVHAQDGQNATLNTGLVTLQNYGRYLPSRLVQLTFAHELGHSLGAPHDEGSDCGNLGSSGGKGRYLMFPHATNEVQENNDKFSPCSIKHIGKLLGAKKDECFVVSDHPICGNLIVEEGEECDVGHIETDPCCYSANEPQSVRCHLKPGKICSPSQGQCCSSDCVFKPQSAVCKAESDCEVASRCTGTGATCPAPSFKPNMTSCSLGTRVCLDGECARSICMKHGLEQCDYKGESRTEKCHMCCQQPGEPKSCASTTSSVLFKSFKGARIALVAGSPCSDKQGYCDKFHVCRLLDADGPIARLKNSFLQLDDFDDVADWMKAHWWAILLAILTLSAVMAGTAFACGRQ